MHIANSHYTASELPFNARHPRPVYVRPMGVDVGVPPARRNTGAQRCERVWAFCGTPCLSRRRAARRTSICRPTRRRLSPSGAHLIVAGDGPRRHELERLANGSRDRIHFHGHLADRGALADLMTDVDLFVHPNPREPFGIAPLEAMSAGLPLVAPDRGGVTTYATTANAWIAPATVQVRARGAGGMGDPPNGNAAAPSGAHRGRVSVAARPARFSISTTPRRVRVGYPFMEEVP